MLCILWGQMQDWISGYQGDHHHLQEIQEESNERFPFPFKRKTRVNPGVVGQERQQEQQI